MSRPSEERHALLERRLAALKVHFAAELPAQVSATASSWVVSRQANAVPGSNANEFAALRQALHRLVGSAGSFGFDEVSALARKLEQQVTTITSAPEDEGLVREIDRGMAELERLAAEAVVAAPADQSLSAQTLPETN